MTQQLLLGDAFSAEAATPLLKWPGGKTRELDVISRLMPTGFRRYFEPFVGGGAVFWTVPPETSAFVNDRSEDLIAFYRRVADGCPALVSELRGIDRAWKGATRITHDAGEELVTAYEREGDDASDVAMVLARHKAAWADVAQAAGLSCDDMARALTASVTDKAQRMPSTEERHGPLCTKDVLANLEAAVKAALYTALRADYNQRARDGVRDARRCALFLFLRENCYAAMFRFNADGEFNVPYGGISYNSHDLGERIRQLSRSAVRARLENTVLDCGDFADALSAHPPGQDDFVFVDPPYDTEFADYDRCSFDESDQRRLAAYLREDCDARFLAVVKDTALVREIYAGLHAVAFDKTYAWTIKSRNDRRARHVAIVNYELDSMPTEVL